MLSADELRNRGAMAPPIHLLSIEAWGGETIAIQELDGLQIFEWERTSGERYDKPELVLTKGTGAEHLAVLSVVTCDLDAEGKPIRGTGKQVFSSSKIEDIQTVRKWGSALYELFGDLLRINRLLSRNEKDAEKNSLTTPSSGTGST